MIKDDVIFLIDDDYEVETLVMETFKQLKEKCEVVIEPFNELDSAMKRGCELKEKVKCCIYDPVLNNQDALDVVVLRNETITRINTILENVNPQMKIIVLTNMNPINGKKLQAELQNKIGAHLAGFIYKHEYVSDKLNVVELTNKIISYL